MAGLTLACIAIFFATIVILIPKVIEAAIISFLEKNFEIKEIEEEKEEKK